MNKKLARIRRATRARRKLRELDAIRLVIHRTPRHIYAQIIDPKCSETIVSASTVEKHVVEKLQSSGNKSTGNKAAAVTVGRVIAEKALKKGIKNVSLDRSGFKYHGRIQALANAARKSGLNF